MEILTFSEVANYFGVSQASISRWVKAGKLEEGPKAGKIKTVTKKSVDFLSSDKAFQIGLESIKKSHKKTRKEKSKTTNEIEKLKKKSANPTGVSPAKANRHRAGPSGSANWSLID